MWQRSHYGVPCVHNTISCTPVQCTFSFYRQVHNFKFFESLGLILSREIIVVWFLSPLEVLLFSMCLKDGNDATNNRMPFIMNSIIISKKHTIKMGSYLRGYYALFAFIIKMELSENDSFWFLICSDTHTAIDEGRLHYNFFSR